MTWRKIFRRTLTAIFIVAGLLTAAIVGAAVQIFEGAGQYIMSDFENHDIAKQRAQQRAEKNAQKQAGVALKTFSRSINSELTDEEVSAVTNNIIKVSDVKIVPVPFEAEGEAGLMYRATLKATIDTDGIYAWLKRDDKEKVTIIQQNDSLQDAIQKNDKQIEDLKEKYKRATSEAEKNRIRKQMTDSERDFLANQKLEEGNKLYYAKDYHGAIKIYDEVLKFGDYSEAYNNRGVAYDDLRQYERAIQDYNKAIQLDPNNAEAYNNRGNAYAKGLKQYERAIQDYNKAIQLNPNDERAYNNRGISYRNLKQYERAIQDYDKAIQLNPNLYQAYNNRGNAYGNLGQYERAIQDYNKAIQLNPNYAEAYNSRGFTYYIMKKYDLAFKDANKALQLNSNLAECYDTRGCIYLAMKNYDKALADFNKALSIMEHPVIYVNRGETYYYLKNYEKAFADLNKAIELGLEGENLGEVLYYRGLCYQATGNNEKAQADFAKAKQLGWNG